MLYISSAIHLKSITNYEDRRNRPFIGYHSVFRPNDISAVGMNVADGSLLRNIWSPDTYTFFKSEPFSGISELHFFNSDREIINYVGIVGHNMSGGSGASYAYQIFQDFSGDLIPITDEKIPENNDLILEYFEETRAEYIVIKFRAIFGGSLPPSSFLRIAHAKIGRGIYLQRRRFVGVKPYKMDVSYDGVENVSDNGNYLGSYVVSESQNWEIRQDFNTPDFVRMQTIPFIKHMNGVAGVEKYPPFTFFAAWRPDDYPDECLYCWKPIGEKVVPEISGRNGLMTWNASGKGVR